MKRVKLANNKLLLVLALLTFGLFIFVSYLVFNNQSSGLISKSLLRFNNIELGVSSENDIRGLAGEPESINKKGDTTTLSYSGRYEVPKDVVVLNNNKVSFYIETVFDQKEGMFEEYKKKFGLPDIILYEPEDEDFVWNIFLKEGLGVATTAYGHVGKIMRFEPTTKEVFMTTVALQANLSTEQVRHEEPPIVAP